MCEEVVGCCYDGVLLVGWVLFGDVVGCEVGGVGNGDCGD